MFKGDIYDYNLPIAVEIQFTWQHSRSDYKYTLLYFHKIVARYTLLYGHKIVAGVYTITNPIKRRFSSFLDDITEAVFRWFRRWRRSGSLRLL